MEHSDRADMSEGQQDLMEGSSQDQVVDQIPGQKSAKPKKKRLSPVNSENDPVQNFFFVDSTSSKREKRAYVMRRHIQMKRSQNALSAKYYDSQPAAPQNSRGFTWRINTDTASSNAQNAHNQEQESAHSSSAASDLSGRHESESPPPAVGMPDTPNEESVDDIFPMKLSPAEYELIDDWHKLSYWSGRNSFIKEKVFRRAARHPIPFMAVTLGYCARWRAHRTGITQHQLINKYSTQIELAVNNPIGSRMDEDDLVMTLTGLALQEERYGEQAKASECIQRVLQIQRNRTTMADGVAQAFSFFFLSVMVPRSYIIPLEGMQSLVDFLRRGEELVAKQNTAEYLAMVPRRASIFGYESDLYRLLASGPRPSRVPPSDRSYVVNKMVPTTDWTHSAALIYLLTALLSLRDSPSRTSRFLDYLMLMVRKYGLDRDESCESLAFLLTEEDCDYDLKASHRVWATADLLQMIKVLPRDLQFRFNELVLGQLMMTSRNDSVDNFEKDLYAIR